MDILLLQSDPASAQSLIGTFLFPILIFAVLYFFMIRPNQVKQKKLLESLAVGQEVVLSSGILGKIVKIDDEIVTILVDEKSKLRVLRSAIGRRMGE